MPVELWPVLRVEATIAKKGRTKLPSPCRELKNVQEGLADGLVVVSINGLARMALHADLVAREYVYVTHCTSNPFSLKVLGQKCVKV